MDKADIHMWKPNLDMFSHFLSRIDTTMLTAGTTEIDGK